MSDSLNIQPIEQLAFIQAFKSREGKKRKYGLAGVAEKAGVYFIKEDDVLVYVGMSRVNLQKALYRHFQCWKSWSQRRVVYIDGGLSNYKVACITTDKESAHDLEKAYIVTYNPRDNFDRYEKYKEEKDIEVVEYVEDFTGIVVGDLTEPLPF